ncbi:MAG: hypothetical protein WAX69_00585 [Victivallales bacterium]
MNKDNDTFELIRQARLEKIRLDVKLKKLKLEEEQFRIDENNNCHFEVGEVMEAIDKTFESQLGKNDVCKKCIADMKMKIEKLLNLED